VMKMIDQGKNSQGNAGVDREEVQQIWPSDSNATSPGSK
jgi:hypothetical protein